MKHGFVVDGFTAATWAQLGAIKASSHAEVEKAHRARPLAERMARSWALFEAFREKSTSTLDDSGPLAFYERARALGLIRRQGE